MLPHNKIIKTTVKEFLEPENLFQIGSSRSWVDDKHLSWHIKIPVRKECFKKQKYFVQWRC